MRLHINYRKKICKIYKYTEAKQSTINNPEITEEVKEEIKKFLETNENMTTQNPWMQQKQF